MRHRHPTGLERRTSGPRCGQLSYKQVGRTGRFTIGGGFAEVRDNVVTVLADSGEAVA